MAGGTGGAGDRGSTMKRTSLGVVFLGASVPASAFATATHAALRSAAFPMLASTSFFSLPVGKRLSVASVTASRTASSDFFAAINSPTSFCSLSACGIVGGTRGVGGTGVVGGSGGSGWTTVGGTGGFGVTFGSNKLIPFAFCFPSASTKM